MKSKLLLKISIFLGLFYTPSSVIAGLQQNVDKKSELPLQSIDYILIKKKERILELYSHHELIKTYFIALGFNPIGHKEQEGDGKTPEGKYIISYKNPNSKFYLSLKISYPSEKDRQNAASKRISLGGDIMIHGLGKQFGFLGRIHVIRDWTLGCVAVTNTEIKEIYDVVQIGTVVEIQP